MSGEISDITMDWLIPVSLKSIIRELKLELKRLASETEWNSIMLAIEGKKDAVSLFKSPFDRGRQVLDTFLASTE